MMRLGRADMFAGHERLLGRQELVDVRVPLVQVLVVVEARLQVGVCLEVVFAAEIAVNCEDGVANN